MCALPIRNSFRKSERICGQNAIENVYKKGKSKIIFPFKLIWFFPQHFGLSKCRVLISVPKRNFKKAHDRNRIKRQVREAYRVVKHPLLNKLEEEGMQLDIAFLFVGKQELSSCTKQIEKLITFLCDEISSQDNKNQQ